MMLTGKNIVLFSSDDWKSGLKTSKYHIAIRLARANKVLFVNSIGLRKPSLNRNDLKRIFVKIKAFFKGYEKINENLYIYTPIVVPFYEYSSVKKLNSFLLVLSLKVVMFFLKMTDPVLLIFSPNFCSVIGKLKEKGVIYYCVDELLEHREVNKEKLLTMEEELLRKSQCVIACSRALEKTKKEKNPNTFYVPHGVNWELFKQALNSNLEVPKDVKTLPKPIIGYFGFLSDDWIDFDLLNYLAEKRPQWSIVLIGKTKEDLSKILRCKNIRFLGARPFESLPAYCKGFDVGIIPFKLNGLTLNSSPLKLLEYLSSGLPVVTVDIPEVHQYGHLISVASDHADFLRKIEKAVQMDTETHRLERSRLMQEHTWDSRLNRISEIIDKYGCAALHTDLANGPKKWK